MADLSAIKDYFGYENLSAFGKDWRELSDDDKAQIRGGIEDGSLTY